MVRLKETPDKYLCMWSGQKVKHALTMLKTALDELGLLDEQDTRLLTLTMDNLCGDILNAIKIVKDLKKEVKF